MNAPVKLGGFVAGLAAVLALSFGVGGAVGPIGPIGQTTHSTHPTERPHMTDPAPPGGSASPGASPNPNPDHGAHGDHGGEPASLPGGLMISQQGYSLDLEASTLPVGRTPVRFRVSGPDGKPVTRFEPTHDKDLHFIAARRDMSGFQHVHPTVDEAGTWTTSLDLTPGVWRVFADFRPAGGGETLTLGADLSVAGAYAPQPLPPVSQTAVVDGYTVRLDGRLTPGRTEKLTLNVSRGGQAVTDLQPYLAAYGHLVALRVGDLAYLHVHPDGEPGDGKTRPGPDITFFAAAPSPGAYRLYLDFQHDGVVRTAEFTVQVSASGASGSAAPTTAPASAPSGDHGAHDHN